MNTLEEIPSFVWRAPRAARRSREALLTPARYWLGTTNATHGRELVGPIIDAFCGWAKRQADADGMVRVKRAGGLLSPGVDARFPLSQLEPWQCGGELVRNNVDLAFRVWLDNDPAFNRLIAKHGLGLIFSVVGYFDQDASHDSLERLSGMLSSLLCSEVEAARLEVDFLQNMVARLFDRRQNEKIRKGVSLVRARAVANANRKASEEAAQNEYFHQAVAIWESNPSAKKDEVVDALAKMKIIVSGQELKRKESTIRRYIATAKAEGLKAATQRRKS